jgi:hypothetical protein
MPGPKQNNRRVYPNANHQPMHKAADRVDRAQARQEVYDELTLEQKIARLPPEPQAKKQRARLTALLEKRDAPKAAPSVSKDAPTTENNSDKQKKYMKGTK